MRTNCLHNINKCSYWSCHSELLRWLYSHILSAAYFQSWNEIQSTAVETHEEWACELLWAQTYAGERRNTISSCKRSHTKALMSEREMEFRFILSSLKLPFSPWPRLSKRRRKELCLSPQNSSTRVLVRQRRQGMFLQFLALRDYTYSASAVRNHRQTAGNVFWINQCTIS